MPEIEMTQCVKYLQRKKNIKTGILNDIFPLHLQLTYAKSIYLYNIIIIIF